VESDDALRGLDKGSGEIVSKKPKGFVVYGTISEVLDRLSDEETGRLFKGMVKYFVDGIEPKFKGVLEFIFIPIRQQMDSDVDKYEEKCERNRANANKRWQTNANAYDRIQSDAMDANINKNININERERERENIKSAETDDSTDNLVFFKGFK